MQVDLKNFILQNQTVAVAVSGGSDSVALLHYMLSASKKNAFKVVALNVEHGIRGESSLSDSLFVKNLCEKWGVPLFSYTVDSLKKAKEEKLSVEQSARALRYECFYKAIESGVCDKVATAHHESDNAESILFNLFRGTSLAGVSGIEENFENKIIRPFLTVSKKEIEEYISQNNLEFVTDETNLDDNYTRNFIRLNVLPEIKKVFPEVEKSITRFSKIAREENEFLDNLASEVLTEENGLIKISLPLSPVLLSRATVIALKKLGVKKDWEKAHIDAVNKLAVGRNGAKADLKNGVMASKEYDELVFSKHTALSSQEIPFALGETVLENISVNIVKVERPKSLKDGFYLDLDKIPASAVIRFKKDGDLFTKFGGGTKPLAEYLTDKKIPLRERDFIPVIADGNTVLAIIGIAISDKIKVDDTTSTVIKIF